MADHVITNQGERAAQGERDAPLRGSRAVVVNHWHDDNKGDSAITAVTLDLLERHLPGVDIQLVSMLGADDPAFARSFRHINARFPRVRTRGSFIASLGSQHQRSPGKVLRWALRVAGTGVAVLAGHPPRELADAIDSCDVVVVVGGSDLFDTGRHPPLGTLRLLQCVLPVLVARRRHVPYVLLGHTLGPVSTRLGRSLLRGVVRDAALVVVREAHSARLVQEELGLGVGAAQTAPDVAFALSPSPSLRVLSVLAALRGLRFAVVVPRAYHHPDPVRDARLADELGALGRSAVERGLVDAVVVFPQCLGPTPVEDDRNMAAAIVAANPEFRIVDVDLNPSEVAELYRHATFVVAVRLHALILALSVGTPVHGIEYFTNKTRGVLESAGISDHWSGFDSFVADHALDKLTELITDQRREELRTRVAEMRSDVLDIPLGHSISSSRHLRGAGSRRVLR